ncbi:MAG TPA: DNRLRE domain-containing protein, partial [Anaerolineae bacterium]|nr:DNRLRE domain-containing protein [Anaerolineae bacterium]
MVTLVLQPDGTAGKDTWIQLSAPDTNNDGSSLATGGGTGNKSLVQFDISSIPAYSTIISATLELHCLAEGAVEDILIQCHALLVDWVEAEATWNVRKTGVAWNTAGCLHATLDYEGGTSQGTDTFTDVGNWLSFDCTDAVTRWYAGTLTNNGLHIWTAVGASYKSYEDSENATADNRPKLTIVYTLPVLSSDYGISPVRYQPILLNQATGEALEVPTDWISIQYVSNVCRPGWCDLTLPGDFSLGTERDFTDWRLVIWRHILGSRSYIDWAGFVRDRVRTYVNGESRLILSGPDYMDMIDRRIVAYAASTTYSLKAADAADDMMKELMRENLGASAVDTTRDYSTWISIQADLTQGTSVRKGCSWADLLPTLQQIYETSQGTAATATFFGVVPLGDGYDMEFRTKVGQWGQDHRHPDGVDGAHVFSIEWGNLDNVRQGYQSSDEYNYLYGMGEGQRSDRLQTTATSASRIAKSVINRRERAYENTNAAVVATLTSETAGRLQEG